MKKWLLEHFLPMWAKQSVLADNRVLQRENQELHRQNRELRAYIRGLRTGLRRGGSTGTQGGTYEHL